MEMSYIFANENFTSSSVSNLKGIFRAEKGIRNEEVFLRAASIHYRAAFSANIVNVLKSPTVIPEGFHRGCLTGF